MAKDCPKFDETKYEVGLSFNGLILSIYSKVKHLIYCINSEDVPKMVKIDSYKNFKKLYKKPQVGSFFVYYSTSRKSYFRAYNLGTNPAEPAAMKAFLIDNGEVHYLTYDKRKFFYLPSSLQFGVLGIFCKINFPDDFKFAIDFMEQKKFERVKFRVTDVIKVENELGPNETCLLVDIIDNSTNSMAEYSERESKAEFCKLTKSALAKLECVLSAPTRFTYSDLPQMAKMIPRRTSSMQQGQKVVIYPGIMLRSNLFYGSCKSIHDTHHDTKSLILLMTKMNRFNVEYELLFGRPRVNEMVVVCESPKEHETRYYRGMVLEKIDEICMILYVDYGYTRPFHYKTLFKLPIEFSKTPFLCARIRASNVQGTYDQLEDHKDMLIVDKNIHPYCYGVIETINGFDITVRLFDRQGIDMNEVLMRFNKPLLVPSVSKNLKSECLTEDKKSSRERA